MNSRLRFAALIGMAVVGIAAVSHANADAIIGEWSNPILNGYYADGATGALYAVNNSPTAVDSITSGSSPNDTLTWGFYTDIGSDTCLSIYPTPCFSSITFSGTTSIPTDPTTPFQIGTLTYTNGTSDLDSIIFGATLTFYKVTGATQVAIGSDFVSINTTSNTGTVAQNADYINFSGLADTSFNVYEGATAVGGLDDYIIGDPQLTLTGITVDSTQTSNGFVSNSPPLPAAVPEPASLSLFGAALVALMSVRWRKRAYAFSSLC